MPRRSETVITQELAAAAPVGLIFDALIPGFGLRTLRRGSGTWLLKYRAADGAQRWQRIGRFPSMGAPEARERAERLRGSVERGGDPSAGLPPRGTGDQSLAELAEAYALTLEGRPSMRGPGVITRQHAETEARQVRAAIRRMGLGERGAHEATPAHVLALVRLEATRPSVARQMFGALRRFFEWCLEEGVILTNPCDRVPRAKRPRAPRSRQRVVPLRELARLWIAAEGLPHPQGALARLLIALPVRRNEAARCAWENLDLAHATWTIPGAITKNGDTFRIALHPLVLGLLRGKRQPNEWPRHGLVFPGARSGKPYQGWTRTNHILDLATGFADWTWHDFRRSFATHLGEAGVAEPVADAVLNHRQAATRGGVLGVYQRARRWPEQRAAVESWGAALADAIATEKRRKWRPRSVTTPFAETKPTTPRRARGAPSREIVPADSR
jgi:integrase